MTDLSQIPTEELLKLYQQPEQPRPLSSMSTDELLRLYQQPQKSDTVGGVGSEIKRAFTENLDAVKRVYTDYQPDQPLQHLGRVGGALAAIPGMAAAPITGTARSLIGGAYDAVADNLFPLTDDQKKQFGVKGGREAADLAMMGVAPRSASPIGTRSGATRTVQPPTPGPDDVAAARTSAYQNPAVTGLRIDPQAANNFVAQTRQDMLRQRVDPVVAPTVERLLTNLENPRFGAAHEVADFDLIRQSLRDVPRNEARAAGIVRRAIDNYLDNIPARDVVAGNAPLANEILRDARGNHAALMRHDAAAEALGRAENQAPSIYSGQNLNNATRQQFRPLLNEKMGVSKVAGHEDYTPAELEQLTRIVRGTATGNSARLIAKEIDKLPIPFVGRIVAAPFRAVGNASTQRQAETLAELLLSRSPLAQSLPPVTTAAPNPIVGSTALPPSLAQLLAQILSARPLVPSYAEGEQR